MNRVHTLREQAAILRQLAESFEDAKIKADLLSLSERCERLAEIVVTKTGQPKPSPSA